MSHPDDRLGTSGSRPLIYVKQSGDRRELPQATRPPSSARTEGVDRRSAGTYRGWISGQLPGRVLHGTSAGRALLLEAATRSFARGLAWTADVPIVRAVRTVRIAIGVRNFTALRPDQKLFAHFGETGTAIFAVEQVEYGWHDRPLRFDDRSLSGYHTSWHATGDLDHNPSEQ
jgi:hypothetical protein